MPKTENLTPDGDYKKIQLFQIIFYLVLALMFFGSLFLFLNLSFLLLRNLDYSLVFDFPYFYKIIDFIEYGMDSGNFFELILAYLLFAIAGGITLLMGLLCFLLLLTPVMILLAFLVLFILLMKPVSVKKCIAAILITTALIIVVVYMRENIALCYVLLMSILPFFFVKKTKGILTLLFTGTVIFISMYFIDKSVSVLLVIGYFFVFIPKIKYAERNIKIVSAMALLLAPLITFIIITAGWGEIALIPGPGLADFGYELINNYELSRSSAHEVKIYYHNKNTAYRNITSFLEIPPKVMYAGWDNKFIIAKQLGLKRAFPDNPKNTYMKPDWEVVNYWILDTEIHKLYGPYNESEFKAERNKLQVPPSLELKRVRAKSSARPPMTSDDYRLLIIQIYIMLLPFMILLYLFIHRRFLKLKR